VGYHIIRCTEHVAPYVQPLTLVYGIVASELARVRADTIAMQRADSLLRVVKTPAQGRAAAARLGFELRDFLQSVDEPTGAPEEMTRYFDKLFAMKAGEVMPFKWTARGEGYWITWVDTISTAGVPSWENARSRAIAAYRAGAGERALVAKAAELDSLAGAGWSLDSLAVLWGGLKRSEDVAAAGTSEKGSIPPALDSLVFGSDKRPPALEPGQESGWVRWPGGVARVRLVERRPPSPDRLAVRIEELRKAAVERKLSAWFDDLKKRYPVRILDRSLAAIPLPAPPEE